MKVRMSVCVCKYLHYVPRYVCMHVNVQVRLLLTTVRMNHARIMACVCVLERDPGLSARFPLVCLDRVRQAITHGVC